MSDTTIVATPTLWIMIWSVVKVLDEGIMYNDNNSINVAYKE